MDLCWRMAQATVEVQHTTITAMEARVKATVATETMSRAGTRTSEAEAEGSGESGMEPIRSVRRVAGEDTPPQASGVTTVKIRRLAGREEARLVVFMANHRLTKCCSVLVVVPQPTKTEHQVSRMVRIEAQMARKTLVHQKFTYLCNFAHTQAVHLVAAVEEL